MKYKVLKEFGCAKKGDVLTNSVEDPEVYTMEVEDDNNYRYMSISDDIAGAYCEEEYLLAIDERSDMQRIKETEELLDELINTYDEDYKTAMEKAEAGELPPAIAVEAKTVYYNLTKVLNRVKDTLTKEYDE